MASDNASNMASASGNTPDMEAIIASVAASIEAGIRSEVDTLRTDLAHTKADLDAANDSLNALRTEVETLKAETLAGFTRRDVDIHNLSARVWHGYALHDGDGKLVQMRSLANHEPIPDFPKTTPAVYKLTNVKINRLLRHLRIPLPQSKNERRMTVSDAIGVAYLAQL